MSWHNADHRNILNQQQLAAALHAAWVHLLLNRPAAALLAVYPYESSRIGES